MRPLFRPSLRPRKPKPPRRTGLDWQAPKRGRVRVDSGTSWGVFAHDDSAGVSGRGSTGDPRK